MKSTARNSIRRVILSLVTVLVSLFLSGCISYLSMRKVTNDNDTKVAGLRVYLPSPFIVVRDAGIAITINADKTVTTNEIYQVDVEMLPDRDKEYAVNYWTILGKQNVTVSRSVEMYLKQIGVNEDSTAVAQQMIAAAGQVAQSTLQTAKNTPSPENPNPGSPGKPGKPDAPSTPAPLGTGTTPPTTGGTPPSTGGTPPSTGGNPPSTGGNPPGTGGTPPGPGGGQSNAVILGSIKYVFRICEQTNAPGPSLRLVPETFPLYSFSSTYFPTGKFGVFPNPQ